MTGPNRSYEDGETLDVWARNSESGSPQSVSSPISSAATTQRRCPLMNIDMKPSDLQHNLCSVAGGALGEYQQSRHRHWNEVAHKLESRTARESIITSG